MVTEEIREKLSRFLPLAIVLRCEDGKVEGCIENSFSMGKSERDVRIWWSGKAYSFLGEHDLNGIEDATYQASAPGYKVYDPLQEDCPVEIDWDRWLKCMETNNKYGSRNALFKVKLEYLEKLSSDSSVL